MQQAEVIQIEIETARAAIERAEALNRLHDNADFKSIMLEGYLENEAVRLVHLRGEPSMQAPERQANILREIDAIGSIRGYFRTIYMQAEQSVRAIESSEEELALLHGGDQ